MNTDTTMTSPTPTPSAPDPRLRMLVRDTLESAQSFKELPAPEQKKIAHNLMQVMSYLNDPHAGLGNEVSEVAKILGDKKEDPSDKLRNRVAGGTKQAGQDFKGGAAREGATVFKELVKSVDFVGFVSGLIDGVYNSIVNSTIKQMMAFSQFLEAVVKSAEEFANDHVSENQARDHLVSKFPNALQINGLDEGEPKVGFKPDIDDKDKPDFKQALGVDANLDDEEGEKMLVQGMRLQVARQRQQMLSTMLLMGINRIVVTEGEIKASVLFEVSSKDTSNRTSAASMDDTQTHADSKSSSSFWGTDSSASSNTRVSTASASDQSTSESKLESHAKLTGYVQVKFKSETFPLEKLATGDQLSAVQGKSEK
jgi:hypothetical protein